MAKFGQRGKKVSGPEVDILLTTLVAFQRGDLSVRMPKDWTGASGKLADTLNEIIDMAERTVDDLVRVSQDVGKAGKVNSRLPATGLHGAWAKLVDSNNDLVEDLVAPMIESIDVVSALANGDLTRRVPSKINGRELEGHFLKSVEVVNALADQLFVFSSEITRVAREVGTEGKLGGQANVQGARGTWRDLGEAVNSMADNLTIRWRNVGKVATAIAQGDLGQKISIDAKGEFLQIKEVVNSMVDQLSTFSSEVIRVAHEVGTEGRLGGQVIVPGAAGTWKDLTENVNRLAANLTTQVRAIAEVATMVTQGDFTRSVTVDARGEVAELKDNVNEMIRNLRDSTKEKSEQVWIKTNVANCAGVLQGQNDLVTMSKRVFSEIGPLVNVHHGAFYVMEMLERDEVQLRMLSSYAHKERSNVATKWKLGEGLVGQCALEKTTMLLTEVPGDYVQITSGLGAAKPLNLLLLPILFEGKVEAVIELASFTPFSLTHQAFLAQIVDSIGVVMHTIRANMVTEELLKQSQTLTEELQSQQEELRQTNDELGDKAHLLEEQKREVELKNREVIQAKAAVEEKAAQLELTSKYKSEFLSNMSHELRTPLNSLLILAQQLAENSKGHLDDKEVQFAKLIEVSGNDLLALINEILDLSKIESGTVSLELSPVSFVAVGDHIKQTFAHVANNQKLDLDIVVAEDMPSHLITDEMRLLQVLKNLLANAFKFTENGRVSMRIKRATSGWSTENEDLNKASEVFTFSVEDTGIGISAEKQQVIFEAFQQGDGRTARKYGGTGLGLSISREIAHLLGGELVLARSKVGQGSTFVLYVPQLEVGGFTSESKSQLGEWSSSELQSEAQDAKTAGETGNPDRSLGTSDEEESLDDRTNIEDGDRVLLIIEDDPIFAKVVLELAREKGFKGIVAFRGAQGLALARNYRPDAITLDINIPDMDGWTVLDILKRDPDLRHIPVDVITVEDNPLRGLSLGAFQYLTKPVNRIQLEQAVDATRQFLDRPMKKLLLVAADKDEEGQITELLGDDDISIRRAANGKEGLFELGRESFDCVVAGTKLADMSGADFIAALLSDKSRENIPAVVYSSVPLNEMERNTLDRLTASGVVKSAESLDRLLDQTALFLHRVVSRLPEKQRILLRDLQHTMNVLDGKKVLIVDDDARNIFALSSVLERKGMIVLSVDNGRSAIDLLGKTLDMDIVLMDIMMPEMDGYETMREIRREARFKKLPIIALTAKAMVGDREKCLEAGASDYLSKPVNIEQLSSLMQVWLSR